MSVAHPDVAMFTLRSSGLVLLCATSACLSEPTFVTSPTGEPSNAASGSADMALVPATTLGGDTLQPTGGPKDEKEKPGKEKPGKGGPGQPPPGPSPEPAPPSEPSSEPSTATTVPSFWIDLREVSANDYEACVDAGVCSATPKAERCASAASSGSHPANCVTKAQAAAFCTWRDKRLVRNDEWTAAVSGATARPYAWGTDAPTALLLNACGAECAAGGMYSAGDGFAATAPVASFPSGRSPEGVFDLAGNVAEWVEDTGSVVRGGSFADSDPAAVAATASRAVTAETAEPTIGFRCARDSK